MLVEKGGGDTEDVELIIAAPAFRLVATMNPGGDFGKKEVTRIITSVNHCSSFSKPFRFCFILNVTDLQTISFGLFEVTILAPLQGFLTLVKFICGTIS